ncbi:MAG: hypothetical protein JO153_15070, partial [Solirubrobacterales bacterium]|nr:hypothetical protein [Solirubrobacterales bacterium]
MNLCRRRPAESRRRSLCAATEAGCGRALSSERRQKEEGVATRSKPVIAVDVGGTFTDLCLLDPESGQLDVAKVPSTANPIDGVLAGVEQAGVDLADIGLFSHGTTVATNALITRRLPKAAMVTTRGFR